MRAQIGDCKFYAEGGESFVDDCFRQWLEAARKHWRRPIEEKIANLHAELREQRRLLRIVNNTTPTLENKGEGR